MARVGKVDIKTGEVAYVEEDLQVFEMPVLRPESVSRRQARRALLKAGLLDQVDVAIDAIQDIVTREAMRIDWQDATDFRRDNGTLIALAAALGLDDEQLDDLFIQASQF